MSKRNKEGGTRTFPTFLLPLIYVESLYKSLSNKLELQKCTIYIFEMYRSAFPVFVSFRFSSVDDGGEISPLIMWSRFSLFTLNHVYVSETFIFTLFPLFCVLAHSCFRVGWICFTFTSVAAFTFNWFCWSVNRTNQRRRNSFDDVQVEEGEDGSIRFDGDDFESENENISKPRLRRKIFVIHETFYL